MSFYTERPIKSVRKARPCEGCGSALVAGEPALACSGINYDGDFWSATYHRECRDAEEAMNKLYGSRYDEWAQLSEMEWDDWPWLIETFPAVAAHMKITTERYEEVVAERERCRKAWAEIDAKRRAPTSPGASS